MQLLNAMTGDAQATCDGAEKCRNRLQTKTTQNQHHLFIVEHDNDVLNSSVGAWSTIVYSIVKAAVTNYVSSLFYF